MTTQNDEDIKKNPLGQWVVGMWYGWETSWENKEMHAVEFEVAFSFPRS